MVRRGFTLVELVASLFVTSVVVGAMASSIALVSRALPDSSKPTESRIALQRVLAVIGQDIRYAGAVSLGGGAEMSLEIPDRDGDAEPDQMKYAWGGQPGDALVRKHESFGETLVIGSANSVRFEWVSDISAPSFDAILVTIQVGDVVMTLRQRCLNVGKP